MWLHGIFVATQRIFSCGMWTLSWGEWDPVGIEPRSPALRVWSLSHWTTREVHPLSAFWFPTLRLLSCLPFFSSPYFLFVLLFLHLLGFLPLFPLLFSLLPLLHLLLCIVSRLVILQWPVGQCWLPQGHPYSRALSWLCEVTSHFFGANLRETPGKCSQPVGKGAGGPLVQPPGGEPASAGALLSCPSPAPHSPPVPLGIMGWALGIAGGNGALSTWHPEEHCFLFRCTVLKSASWKLPVSSYLGEAISPGSSTSWWSSSSSPSQIEFSSPPNPGLSVLGPLEHLIQDYLFSPFRLHLSLSSCCSGLSSCLNPGEWDYPPEFCFI